MNWRWSAGVGLVGRVVQADSGAFKWQSVFRDHEGSEYPLSGVNLLPHEGQQAVAGSRVLRSNVAVRSAGPASARYTR
jgi:hypothetical protein